MCGVSGAVFRRDDPAAERFVRRAIGLQMSRGPDHQDAARVDSGGWTVALGHNRLSVIDLAPTGHQPMWGNGRRQVISYNGEIYNYRELRQELEALGDRFHSQSDTEILLAAWQRWGAAALNRCNGMFALALVDLDREELILARDRFGVKPLYYAAQPGQLRFASTLAPLQDAATGPDLQYLHQGLVQGVYEDHSARTPWLGLHSVPAGHLLRLPLDHDRLKPLVEPWYEFGARVAGQVDQLAALGPEAAAERVRDIMGDAVSLRLRSDVPVGVSLSGGLDSATVAVLAASEVGIVRGLTFGHPSDPRTEAPLVAAVAAGRGIEVEHVWPAPERMAEMFWSCLRAQQAPFASPSVVAQYAVFQRARQLGLTVMLGGQGGDEGFMGYRKYHLFRFQAALAKRSPAAVLTAALGLAQGLWGERGQLSTYWWRGRQYATGVGPESVFRWGEQTLPPLGLPPAGGSRARQVEDIVRFSLPTLLRYEDRNSMGHSVESRLPFLDYRVLELGAALPEALKLRGGWGKWIVREAFADRLPGSVTWARAKRGFDVDCRSWLAAGLGGAMRDALTRSVSGLGDLVVQGLRISDYFADTRLASDRAVFADAVALLWLGGWASPRET